VWVNRRSWESFWPAAAQTPDAVLWYRRDGVL